jgi:uncharacterized membrane protein
MQSAQLSQHCPFFIFLKGPELSSYISFLPGWLAHPKEINTPFVWFWIKNWGLFIPVFILGFFKNKMDKKTRQFTLGFVFIFILANIFVFQPSSWDNAKLFLWIHLVFSFTAAGFLTLLWQKHLLGKFIASLLFFILVASGGIDLIRVLHTKKESYVMVNAQEIEMAKFLRSHSESFDIVLTSDSHLHWVPVMSGRSIVMGYRGWLWSHGFNYREREKDIRLIFQGTPEAKELIKKYSIRFVVTDNKTRSDFLSNEEFFRRNYDVLIASPNFTVYKIQ